MENTSNTSGLGQCNGNGEAREGAGGGAAEAEVAEAVVATRAEQGAAEGTAEGTASFAAVSPAEALALALTAAQRTAIEKLTSGCTMIDAAKVAGVTRMTLHRWLKNDAQFQAAYNAWQQDAIATARGRMLALTDAAVTSVHKAMLRGDGRLALRVLEKMGVAEAVTPGPTEVEAVQRRQELERRKEELDRVKEEFGLGMEEVVSEDSYGRFNELRKARVARGQDDKVRG
jgi:hypothetical protein